MRVVDIDTLLASRDVAESVVASTPPSPRHVSDVPSPPPTRTGRGAEITVRADATVDEVRAAVAVAMGHPGCRARVHAGASGGSRASPRSATSPRPPRAKARASCSPSRATRDSRRRIRNPRLLARPRRELRPRAPRLPGAPGFDDATTSERRRMPSATPAATILSPRRRRPPRPRADRDGSRAIRHAWNPREGPHDGSRRARDGRALDGTQRRGGRGARGGGGDERGRGRGRGRGWGRGRGRGRGRRQTGTATTTGTTSGTKTGTLPSRFRFPSPVGGSDVGAAPPSPSPAPSALRVLRASPLARASRARLRSRDGDVRVSSLATHAVHVAPRVVRDARAVSLDDLRAMATLAPASLRLTPVIVAETDDAGVLIGDGGDDADTLVEPTDPDRLPRDADGPEGLPQPRVAVHGALERPPRRTPRRATKKTATRATRAATDPGRRISPEV